MAEAEDIASWMRRQLARRDWRPADLARASGIGSGRISEWMSGERTPSSASCIKLADVFGADPDDVLALAGHREPSEPIEPDDPKRRIIELVRRTTLTPTQARGLEAMLRAWLDGQDNGSEDAS